MLEPSRLPVELFATVMNYASGGRSDLRALCNFSLVSRQWYACLNARIYSRWSYDGEHHSISSLWKFLRAILCNRRIADRVHGLDIRNWTFGLVHGRSRLVLSEDDIDLARNAIRMAGLQRIETSFLEALPKADPRPLMALLLANLRSLTTLYAHIPETDIFLAEVLRKAVEIRGDDSQDGYPPLHGLREAHLTSAWNYREDSRARDEYKLELNHLWPVFQLPNIRTLSVFDFEPLGASNLFRNSSRTSSITDLTLVHKEGSLLAAPDTLALLTLPKKLTHLSIYLDDYEMLRRRNQVSNADLWNGIRHYEDCLEHLDIYRDCTAWGPPHHSANNSHLGSMQGFRHLERLCIQPEVLLGGCCEDDLGPYRLRDTLPPNLKSLTFYGDEGLARNKTLGQQLQEILTRTDFILLSHVALEEMIENTYSYTDPADPPHDEVEQACRRSGIKYETKRASSCTKGGMGCRYYQQVVEKRLRLRKVEDVRYALTEYLCRLRKSTYKDGRSTGDRPQLSSDNLDTYELPWDELTEAALYPEGESESERDSEGPFSEDEEEFDTEDMDSQDISSEEENSED